MACTNKGALLTANSYMLPYHDQYQQSAQICYHISILGQHVCTIKRNISLHIWTRQL